MPEISLIKKKQDKKNEKTAHHIPPDIKKIKTNCPKKRKAPMHSKT